MNEFKVGDLIIDVNYKLPYNSYMYEIITYISIHSLLYDTVCYYTDRPHQEFVCECENAMLYTDIFND